MVTEAASYPDFELYDDPEVKDFLYGMNFPSNFAEILEFDEEIIIASVSEIISPTALSFDQVTDQVFERLRENQANIEIIELENKLMLSINDESYIHENSNVLKDSFISVKRGSTLFPENVINEIISSQIGITKNGKAFNSDVYIYKGTKISEPTDDFIDSVISDYEDFSSTTTLVKLNTIIEKEISNKIKDNIKNLNI